MTHPKAILTNWNLNVKKQLGQNFLADPSTAQMIVSRSNITNEDIILEIGAGLGALTFTLADSAKKVYAIEKDSNLAEILKSEINDKHNSNIILIIKDILNLDLSQIYRNEDQKIIVVGNLPYNISSQVLIKLIHSRDIVIRAVLMFQKELAERIRIPAGNRESSRISVMLQYCADVKYLASVKASLFFPKPKVDSEILEIVFKQNIDFKAKDEAFLFKVIKAGFGQRRKNLKNALLGSELKLDLEIALNALKNAGIDPARRAETLTIEEFVRLSNELAGGS